jgi:hypothetical protein
MQVAAAIPRIARFGPEYEVLVLSGIYREAELVLNIANEALHPLFVTVAVLAGASWQEALPRCCSRIGGSSPWNYGAGMRWLVIAISKRGTTLVRYSDHHGAGSLVNCCGDIIEHSNAGAGHGRNISALNSEFARLCDLAAG